MHHAKLIQRIHDPDSGAERRPRDISELRRINNMTKNRSVKLDQGDFISEDNLEAEIFRHRILTITKVEITAPRMPAQ